MDHIHSFVHLLFLSLIALFPVVNPIGSAFIVDPYLMQYTNEERRTAALKIALYAFMVCAVTLFVGQWILQLFGITIPVIQLAGGIMICKIGWESLSAKDDGDQSQAVSGTHPPVAHDGSLFYPITFPMTTGAGTLSVIFTISAHSSNIDMGTYMIYTSAILTAIAMMCLLVFIFYSSTHRIVQRLGSSAELVVSRIAAFLIFCVGLQIAVDGIKNLVGKGVL